MHKILRFLRFLFVSLLKILELRENLSRENFLPLKCCFLKLLIPCNFSYVRHLPNCLVSLNKQGGHNLGIKTWREENLMKTKIEYPLVSNLVSTFLTMTF